MSYDFESDDHSAPVLANAVTMHPTDLEAIVLLLELGAIELSPDKGVTFTFDELFARARDIGQMDLREGDVRTVLTHLKTIKRVGRGRYCLT